MKPGSSEISTAETALKAGNSQINDVACVCLWQCLCANAVYGEENRRIFDARNSDALITLKNEGAVFVRRLSEQSPPIEKRVVPVLSSQIKTVYVERRFFISFTFRIY